MKRIFLLLLSLVLLMILTTAQADAPVLSLTSGLYEGSVTVEITAPGADAILYTLDGSVPTEENALDGILNEAGKMLGARMGTSRLNYSGVGRVRRA